MEKGVMFGVILAVIRHLVTLGGAGLISRGALKDSDIEALAGAVAVIISIAWSVLEKWRREKAMEKEVGEAINRRAPRGARKTDVVSLPADPAPMEDLPPGKPE